MIQEQRKLTLSPYSALYDILVAKDHFLRRLHDDVDFSFIYQELSTKYSPDMGRTAYDPVMMFKYLILKVLSQLSDVDLVDEVKVNMAYKFFLDMTPEEMPIDSTTLCKFRRQRLKDVSLLDMLLSKTFEIAENKGIIQRTKDNKIHIRAIIDGTHTVSASSLYRPVPALKEWSKKLRKQLYDCIPELKDQIKTDKEISSTDLTSEISYGKYLIQYVEDFPGELNQLPRVKRVLNRFKELIEDILDHYTYSPNDPDARVGHKTADTEFFGYKTQLIEDADSELIVTACVTSGEVGDAIPGKEAVENIIANTNFKIDELIGDTAYSGLPFLELARDNQFELLATPHPNLGSGIDGRDGFTFNKDADMFICPAGHLAISKRYANYKKDNGRKALVYTFDIQKCIICPLKETCLKSAKLKTFSVTVLTEEQKDLLARSQSADFKNRRRERYKIEAKNSHIKRGLGFDKTHGQGIQMMELQTAVTLFVSNMKKIYVKEQAKK